MADAVLLFDGVCNFCNGAVNFIIDRDPRAQVKFASLQSDLGQRLMAEHSLAGTGIDSIVLVEDGVAHTHSTAALRVARNLVGWPSWIAWLRFLPSVLRDPFYKAFAKRRYSWFGKSDQCRVPTPEERARFLG